VNHPGFDAGLMRTALSGAPAPRTQPIVYSSLMTIFIVNDENRWEIAGSYQMARCVKRLAGGRFRRVTGTDGKLPLQKPVSQVRILPGAPTFVQLREHFKLLRAPWAPDVNDPAGRGLLADVAALGPGWGCIIVRIERQPGAGDGGRPSE